MQVIENENLRVTINETGGLLTSIIDKKHQNEELLYQVEEGSWPFQDVVIFPLIGKGEYSLDNKDYSFPLRHGFIRSTELNVLYKVKNKIIFSFESDETSKIIYPVDFQLLLSYYLVDKTLHVETKIINKSTSPIYFSYGSHTGIKANEKGMINYDQNLYLLPLKNGLIDLSPIQFEYKNEIPLDKEIFKKYDTLVFKNDRNELILDNGFNHLVKYEFNAPLFAVWSNPIKGNFVCVEPWRGISNYIDEPKDIKKRKYINEVDKEKIFSYSFTFIYKN